MKLQITLKRSTIACLKVQKDTVAALGLRKIGQTVIKEDNPCIRGQIFRVRHMLEVKEIDSGVSTGYQPEAIPEVAKPVRVKKAKEETSPLEAAQAAQKEQPDAIPEAVKPVRKKKVAAEPGTDGAAQKAQPEAIPEAPKPVRKKKVKEEADSNETAQKEQPEPEAGM